MKKPGELKTNTFQELLDEREKNPGILIIEVIQLRKRITLLESQVFNLLSKLKIQDIAP